MTSIAIIDIDGILVDSSRRFEAATKDGKIDWERALSSELLHLDELIEFAREHLAVIETLYDEVLLLTSRYDHMKDASMSWLRDRWISCDGSFFKPWERRYTKTRIWKAEQVVKIWQEATQPGLWEPEGKEISKLLIVDDDDSNRAEIEQALIKIEASNYLICSSLLEAIKKS